MTKKRLYWIFQIAGWGFLLFFGLLGDYLRNEEFTLKTFLEPLIFYSVGMAITHGYRYFILKRNWLDNNIVKSIPRIILGAIFLGALFFGTLVGLIYIQDLLGWNNEGEGLRQVIGGKDEEFGFGSVSLRIALNIISQAILFFIWSVIYFGYHFFERSRQQEMERLQWAASINETELNNLKAQLNPHFMFNAMNSIRALVDEDPVLCKKAITQLSNLLRNTLQTGKRKVVLIEEEMKIVHDYLALEKIRYEERLVVEIDLEKGIEKCLVPPLLIQTLVENAIKHGVSVIGKGGKLKIVASTKGDELHIAILNDGKFSPSSNGREGIGLKNSTKRLEILYGEKAKIEIKNVEDHVETRVVIPKEEIRTL